MFSKINTLHLSITEIVARGAMALAVALVASTMVIGVPLTASAATPASKLQGFPRLATWWGDNTPAGNAARDYYAPYDWDPIHPNTAVLATLRTLNPNIILLASSSAAEINYSLYNTRSYDAELVGAIPTSWLLTQVGSTLRADLTVGSTSIAVADTGNFRVNDLVVVDDEKCIVTAIGSDTLTVKRGYAGSTVAAHTAGTRIAAVVSGWPGAATLNMTPSCPLGHATGTYATPGTGTERAYDWLARRTAGAYKAASWDGVLIDVAVGNYAACFRGMSSFRTIANPANLAAEADYAAFDTAWQAGLKTFLNSVRILVGPDAVVLTNGAPEVVGSVNGTTFEGFPKSTTTAAQWNQRIVGPARTFTGSYMEWNANNVTPNLTTIMTFGSATDYRLMRFGLTTALMGDGFFAYEASTQNHSSVGRWFDEYDNAGAGKGYLGAPLAASRALSTNLYRRDYAGGAAIVNPTASPVTVQLGASFKKINGTQDRTVNDGTTVTSVTIPARDGIVLLRIAAPAPVVTPIVTPAPVVTPEPTPVVTPEPVATPAPAATVSLQAASTTLAYGQTTSLNVTITPAASMSVRIEKKASTSRRWITVTTLTTDAAGSAQIAATPLATTSYRTVLVSTGTVSNTVTVGVKAKTTLRTSKSSISRTSNVVVSGTVSTARKLTVVLQRKVGAAWKTVKRIATTSRGRYSTTVRLARHGIHSYRIVVAASTSNVRTTSRVASIRVL